MTALKYVMLLQRDVPSAVHFYSKGLGLQVRAATDRWAELGSETQTILALKATEGCGRRPATAYPCVKTHLTPGQCREAFLTTGFSPFLTFTVPDLQQTLTQMLQLGAKMDGAIQYPAPGPVRLLAPPVQQQALLADVRTVTHTPLTQVAAVRAPDGHMITLVESKD